jgi:hypothetical protein
MTFVLYLSNFSNIRFTGKVQNFDLTCKQCFVSLSRYVLNIGYIDEIDLTGFDEEMND